MKNYFVIHEVVDTDHYVYTKTLVKAKSKKEVLKAFNAYLPSSGMWWRHNEINLGDIKEATGFRVENGKLVKGLTGG